MRVSSWRKSFTVIGSIVLLLFVFLPNLLMAATLHEAYPKKANYFLKWEISESEARELAKWDLLILDAEVQEKSRAMIQKIRELNPNIVILAYITPQEIRTDANTSFSTIRRELAKAIPSDWYLKTTGGEQLSWWPGTRVLNVTADAPTVNGEKWQDFLPRFMKDRVLSTGLWDGIFYDNAWESLTYFVGNNIDLDKDGKSDKSLDQKWQEGMKYIYNRTRQLAGSKVILLGNGTTGVYGNELNGNLIENFGAENWARNMQIYSSNNDAGPHPRINVINANTNNTGEKDNYRSVRFGLASVLLDDGYFSYDRGDQDHGQTWHYDEYNIQLGAAIGEAKSLLKTAQNFEPDVYKRSFEKGIALVNSTDEPQTVQLDGEYEKIHGSQDPSVNDGSIVNETTVDAYDGQILLKTFSSLEDITYPNGSFLRFLRPDGSRVRNGFFSFEEGYKGGDQIAHVDLDNNGLSEVLVVSKNKITVMRDDGQLLMKIYPYTANYTGKLRVAYGDLNADGDIEIYVAPSDGYPLPIKVYNRSGETVKDDLYPFGEKYKGGYSLAVGNVSGDGDRLIIGAGIGKEPVVQIYDFANKVLNKWLAFEKTFRGGVNVAAGDVTADTKDEIVVGAGKGKKPLIKIFNAAGKALFPTIQAYTTILNPGIDVRVKDVDYDGKEDIIGVSSEAGF